MEQYLGWLMQVNFCFLMKYRIYWVVSLRRFPQGHLCTTKVWKANGPDKGSDLITRTNDTAVGFTETGLEYNFQASGESGSCTCNIYIVGYNGREPFVSKLNSGNNGIDRERWTRQTASPEIRASGHFHAGLSGETGLIKDSCHGLPLFAIGSGYGLSAVQSSPMQVLSVYIGFPNGTGTIQDHSDSKPVLLSLKRVNGLV